MNRARDDAIDDGLEGVSKAMCYEAFVEYKRGRTPAQVNFMVANVTEMDTRAAMISGVTNIIKVNAYLDTSSVPMPVKTIGVDVGVSIKLYADHDVTTSPWQGQDSFIGLVADDMTWDDGNSEVIMYTWSKYPLLSRLQSYFQSNARKVWDQDFSPRSSLQLS